MASHVRLRDGRESPEPASGSSMSGSDDSDDGRGGRGGGGGGGGLAGIASAYEKRDGGGGASALSQIQAAYGDEEVKAGSGDLAARRLLASASSSGSLGASDRPAAPRASAAAVASASLPRAVFTGRPVFNDDLSGSVYEYRGGGRASLLAMHGAAAVSGHALPSLSPASSRRNVALGSSSRSGSPSHAEGLASLPPPLGLGRSALAGPVLCSSVGSALSPSGRPGSAAAAAAAASRGARSVGGASARTTSSSGEAAAAVLRAEQENQKVLAMLLMDEALAVTPGGYVELLGPLDDELFYDVCSYLGPGDLCNAGAVSYVWAVLCEDNRLWTRYLPEAERAGVTKAGRAYARVRFLDLARNLWQAAPPERHEWRFTDDVDGYHLLPLEHPGARFPLPVGDLRDRFSAANELVLLGGAATQARARLLCLALPCLAPFWAPVVLGRQARVRRQVQRSLASWTVGDRVAGILSWHVSASPLDTCSRLRVEYYPRDARVQHVLAVGFDPPARLPEGGRRATM